MAKNPVVPDLSGRVRVENGTREVYWEYFGHGEKEVVVLLNGVGMMTRNRYRILPNIHPDYDVLLYDYFGQQAKLLHILSNSRQVWVPGSGHMTYQERPDIFWPSVKALFAAKSLNF